MVARNLLIPFRRDRKRDLATGESQALVASKVRQILLTEGASPRSSGELPWRTSFGAALALLRHQSNDAIAAELARVQARAALARWMPGVQFDDIEVRHDDTTLTLLVRVRGSAAGIEAEFSL